MKKSRVLISSVLTIALCLSLISGATFALFTDTSETNVAVTSGKVNVVATIENVQLGSTQLNNVPETSYEVVNGNELVLTGMVPGDYLTFQLYVQNNSDITVLYRTLLKVASDNGLWQGLEVEVNDQSYLGQTKVSNWTSLAPETHPDVVNVKISLPSDAGNAYQGKTCSISYTVEAVQGNAYMTNPDENTTYIYNVTDLLLFADSVKNGTSYAGKTVELMADIDMAGIYWTGIGVNNTSAAQGYLSNIFQGTFKGNGHKVTNMTMSNDYPGFAAAGFFNVLGANATVEGLTIENAVINSTHYAGAIVGWAHAEGTAAQIKNCHVVNASITSNTELVGSNWDNGDKAGGIAGYLCGYTVSDCTVKDSAICAYRDLGGIIGFASNCTIDNCDLLGNVTVTVNKMHNYKNYTEDAAHDANSYVGECNETSVNNCDGTASISAAAMVTNAEELKAALLAGGHVVIVNDIDMGNAWETVYVHNKNLTVDGGNYSITGLNAPLINFYGGTITVNNMKVVNANVTANGEGDEHQGSGVILEQAQWANLYMNNCHVINAKLNAGNTRVGALVGYLIGGAEIKNCSVEDCELSAKGSVAAIIGHHANQSAYLQNTLVENCTVKNNELTAIDSGWRVGTVIGTVAGNINISNCVSTGNRLVQEGNTNPNHELFGRISNTGTLKLNGGEYVADGVTKNEAGEYLISNANGMFWLAEQVNVNGKSFNYETVKLTADIDLQNRDWTPIGNDAAQKMFYGTFDGQNHVISNLKVTDTRVENDTKIMDGVGLFGWLNGDVKNLKIHGATVTGYHNVGVIAGYLQIGTIENCEVKNATVIGNHIDANLCGDKVGGIVGVAYTANANTAVKNCKVIDSSITGGRDIGRIAGAAVELEDIIDCSATNVTVGYDSVCGEHNNLSELVNGLVGRDI